jgi:hypothetical protein
MVTELCKTMKRLGSDKGDDWHNYTLIYNQLFSQKKNEITKLFELGIGSVNPTIESHMKKTYSPGGSLRGWREFFPNAEIYAADIDQDILQPEERITKFYVDQTAPAVIKKMWNSIDCDQFDIIIDDGLHTFEANKTFFENSYTNLRNNGIFIIEDIPTNELKLFHADLVPSAKELGFSTRVLQLKHLSNKTDNNMMIITANTAYLQIVDSLPSELFL